MGQYLKTLLTAARYRQVSAAGKLVYILLHQTQNLKDSDKGQLELLDGYSVASLGNMEPPEFRKSLKELEKAGLVEIHGELIEIKEPLS